MTRKRRRLIALGIGMFLLAAATALVLAAFNENLVFFYSPSDLAGKAIGPDRRIRIGGLVEPQSLRRQADGRDIDFRVTDGKTTVAVVYDGVLPDLFREGQGVVAEGRLRRDGVFRRDQRPRQARREIHAARGRRRAEEGRALAGRRHARSRAGHRRDPLSRTARLTPFRLRPSTIAAYDRGFLTKIVGTHGGGTPSIRSRRRRSASLSPRREPDRASVAS